MISWEEKKLLERARKILPDWTFHLWDDKDNEEIFRSSFPQHLEKFLSIRQGVVRADIIRCVFLYRFGGLYIDTDYKLLRRFDDSLLEAGVLLPVSGNDDINDPLFRVCNSVMFSEPGQPFWRDFVDSLFSNDQLIQLPEEQIEKVTGPEGLTAFYLRHRSQYPEIRTPARKYFHPLITLRGLDRDRSYPSYGAHLCWGSWRSKPLYKKIKTFAVRKITCLSD